MKEASRTKFFFAKYFFLAFGMLQWTCGMLLILKGDPERSRWPALFFFSVGLIFVVLYFRIAERLYRVSIGKKRIAIISKDKTETVEWSDVKYLKPVPYLNVYKLKVRGRKELIYFLPNEQEEPLFGFLPHQPELADVLRKRLK